MEVQHVSSKLRSGYLLTLILSFVDHIERVEILLKLLSKRGNTFLLKNFEQLKHFCSVRPIKSIRFSFDQNLVSYNAPALKWVDQLIINLDKKGCYTHLLNFATNSVGFNNIKLIGNILHHNSVAESLKDGNEEMQGLQILMQKTKKLDLSRTLGAGILITYIQNILPNFENIKELQLLIDGSSLSCLSSAYTIPSLIYLAIAVSSDQFTEENSQYIANCISKFPRHQLKKLSFENRYQEGNLLGLQSQFTLKVLEKAALGLRNIKSLEMWLSGESFNNNFDLFSSFTELEKFRCYEGVFDLDILKHWPKLTVLKVSNQLTSITNENIRSLEKLEKLSLFFNNDAERSLDLLKRTVEKSEKLRQLLMYQSNLFNGPTFFQRNTSVKKMRYNLKTESYENFFDNFHSKSKVERLVLVHHKQALLANFQENKKKLSTQTKNYSLKSLKINLQGRCMSKLFRNVNLSSLKNLQKLKNMKYDTKKDVKELLQDLILDKESKLDIGWSECLMLMKFEQVLLKVGEI